MFRLNKILLIDKQDSSRQNISDQLKGHFEIIETSCRSEGVKLALTSSPDLVLVNPGGDADLVCESLRSAPKTQHLLILIMISENSEAERISAFSRGADDAIDKGCTHHELIARIKSKLRLATVRSSSKKKASLFSGNLELESDHRIARVNGEPRRLTYIEYRLLQCLLERQGEVVTRQDFLRSIWNGTVVGGRTIDTHICSLRRKLRGYDHSISMSYGSGYTLEPNLVRESQSDLKTS